MPLLLAAVLLVLALLDPALPMRREIRSYFLVVDVTQSMNAVDVAFAGGRISRLEQARRLLARMLAELPCGTRVGLGVFSAESVAPLFMPVEVCANYAAIRTGIRELDWKMAWRGNSRLRLGLVSAATLAGSLDLPARVVLLSDGDEAPKLNAVNKTDLAGWQEGRGWLLVGVGGDVPAPIPKFDADGRLLGYWAYTSAILAPSQVQSEESLGARDNSIAADDYERYLSRLEETYLKALAAEIGARYRRGDNAHALARTLEELPAAGSAPGRYPLQRPLILAALLLFLAEYLPGLQGRLQRPGRNPA